MIMKIKCPKCNETLIYKVREENRRKATRTKSYAEKVFKAANGCELIHQKY